MQINRVGCALKTPPSATHGRDLLFGVAERNAHGLRVMQGMAVVREIERVPCDRDDYPTVPVVVTKVCCWAESKEARMQHFNLN